MRHPCLPKLLVFAALVLAVSASPTQAAMFTYAGFGTLTLNGVAHNIYVQTEMDSTLYVLDDIPVLSEPSDWRVGGVHFNFANSTIYIDGYGLFSGGSGGTGGYLALNPDTSKFEMHFSEFFLQSPDTVKLHTYADILSFLNYDGTPYGVSSKSIGNPWDLEYGLCAPQIVLDNDWLYWSQILGDSFSSDDPNKQASISLTLIRQPLPVPEPSILLLLSSGLVCLYRKMRPRLS
ncbi:MAG: hypothetical protein M0036_00185 [Desulfobacteraceae bacterium]|nr:hypothetical protein [Desulfobacteraceae bacterium]